MKRVLVLSYYFPPLGGVGAQRPVKLVKYFGDFGYEAIVVTAPETASVDWAPTDPTLAADVPEGLMVLRAAGPQPSASGLRDRLGRWLGLWTPFHRWWQSEAVRLGRTVVRDVDLVYAPMSPYSTAAAASALAREAGKPWVADLQDPWALDDWAVYPTALHRALDRRRMRRDLDDAAAVIMSTEEAARVLLGSFPRLAPARVRTIPHGWDQGDFVGSPQDRGDDRFRIVFAGYAHVERGRIHRARRPLRTLLGGAVRRMDILARSHVFLLRALTRLRELDPELAARAELHVAGAAEASSILGADAVPVHAYGYLPHDEAVRLMRSADALFLPMQDLPPGMRTRTVPGKTYEYLASGRPILAALPDGDARDLLAGLPNVWLCRPTDVECMAEALAEIGRLDRPLQVEPEVAERFEWQRIAGLVAGVFDKVLGKAPTGV